MFEFSSAPAARPVRKPHWLLDSVWDSELSELADDDLCAASGLRILSAEEAGLGTETEPDPFGLDALDYTLTAAHYLTKAAHARKCGHYNMARMWVRHARSINRTRRMGVWC